MFSHFDLRVLKQHDLNIDRLIQYVYMQNLHLKKFFVKSHMYPEFNDITVQLVREFQKSAESHIKHVLLNSSDYGYLYKLIDEPQFNEVEFNYKYFPLISGRQQALTEIEKIADRFFEKGTIKFEATCLYLLYFFALLVNPHANWIMMDYLNFGNKFHQYFIIQEPHKFSNAAQCF